MALFSLLTSSGSDFQVVYAAVCSQSVMFPMSKLQKASLFNCEAF